LGLVMGWISWLWSTCFSTICVQLYWSKNALCRSFSGEL